MANTHELDVRFTEIEHSGLEAGTHLYEYRLVLPISENEDLKFNYERTLGPWHKDLPVMYTFGIGFHKFRQSDYLVWSIRVTRDETHNDYDLEVKYLIAIENSEHEVLPSYPQDFGPVFCRPGGKLWESDMVFLPDGNYETEVSLYVSKCVKKEDAKKEENGKNEESPRQK